ncbi:MAG: hypothetical protein Q8P44_07790, partial [Dehalococcoidia bacterium]|nr:hypothetical protein [Dehalococcoidia bacterium]
LHYDNEDTMTLNSPEIDEEEDNETVPPEIAKIFQEDDMAEHHQPAAIPVKIAGNCKTNTCSFKVTAADKKELAVTSIGQLSKAIEAVRASFGKEYKPTSKTFALAPGGIRKYELEYKIVDAINLIASHDPFTFQKNKDYPQELQPRLRERAATRLQVDHIAKNLDPVALLTDFKSLDRGAPIIGGDNVVESGNGRIMAIVKAAKDFPLVYRSYRAALKEVASEYGLNPGIVDTMKIPVLVRTHKADVNRKIFVEESNASTTIESSAIEKARTDAPKITLDSLQNLEIGESESLEDALKTSKNKQFVMSFLSKLSNEEQARLVDSKGLINQDGIRRIILALFVRAFPGDTG